MISAIQDQPNPFDRRQFIGQSIRAMTAFALFPSGPERPAAGTRASGYSVQQVIDIILKSIPGAPFPQTVDTLKSGHGDKQVSGIVSTMFATVKVIEQTAALGANMIIAHEPTFYNHLDDTNWVPGNRVLQKKQALLDKHQITTWRFHDYWHAMHPDGIRYGVLRKAGWLSYDKDAAPVFQLPPVSLGKLVDHLKQTLGIAQVRVLGNLDQSCSKIALMPGAAGGQAQISLVEKENPDVLIVGEVHEWETAEYIRDARQLGARTSLIILGHAVSEEPGMDWLVPWLTPQLSGIKVTHIPSGDPFTWV